jgi:hypothetical protein
MRYWRAGFQERVEVGLVGQRSTVVAHRVAEAALRIEGRRRRTESLLLGRCRLLRLRVEVFSRDVRWAQGLLVRQDCTQRRERIGELFRWRWMLEGRLAYAVVVAIGWC